VQSILAQSVRPLEVIVVDDGSTDETADTCAEFPAPVRFIRQKNAGVAAARNTGIREAQGDWIAFCDSDDLWRPEKLEVQLAAVARTGVGWSITDFSIIDPHGFAVGQETGGFKRAFPVFSETRVSPEQHFARWLDGRYFDTEGSSLKLFTGDPFGMLFLGNVVIPSTALVSRDVVAEVGFFDEGLRVAEDTEYFHRVAARSRVTIVMSPLSQYRVGHPSLVAQKSERLIANAILSADRAATLRPNLSLRERDALARGKRILRERLAYSRLAALDRNGVRAALRSEDGRYFWSTRSAALILSSLLPPGLLTALHRAKRVLFSKRR
jgi:hypothetical protein